MPSDEDRSDDMDRGKAVRGEVLMSGVGGGGILTAGLLLAGAATELYTHVSCLPSYDISKRGGRIECTVIFSDDEIASPLLDRAANVVVAEPARFREFQGRISAGGTLFLESSGAQVDIERNDINVVRIPAIRTSIDLSGSGQGAVLVLLGALVQHSGMIQVDAVKKEIQKSFGAKEKILRSNLEAFSRGLAIAG
jgi:2-oxoglutarate ferredoxin oxidoreductase subunit gamma